MTSDRWVAIRNIVEAKFLSVEAYDEAERSALIEAPNRIVACCQPTTFATLGYPTRIHATAAAGRYTDVLHELRTEEAFATYLAGVTREEFDALRAIAIKIADMTEQLYGRRMVPRSGLLRALNMVRQIRSLFEPRSAVFEIGPGCGHLGALLCWFGYRYAAADITQAFYIHQNHVLNAVTNGRVIELATQPGAFPDLAEIPEGYAVHVPWWKYMVPVPRPRLRVEVVTCNHALCEMEPPALAYALRLGCDLLQGAGRRCFVLEGWGSTVRAPIWHVGRALADAGLVIAHNNIPVSVFVRRDSRDARDGLSLPADGDGDENRYQPPIFENPESAIGTALRRGADDTRTRAAYDLRAVDAMLGDVLGRPGLETADELFVRYVSEPRRGATC